MSMNRNQKTVDWMFGASLIFWTAFTFARQLHFQTQAWDMGIFDQLFWNTINGDFMKSSLEEIPNHFGIHFSPTLLLLVPFYYLISSPYTLLFLQTLALMTGVFPLFSMAKRRLPDPFPTIISAGYLLSPSLHWIATYDFHEISFFVPLFLFAWNFMESGKLPLSVLFFALAAGTKEDAVLAVLFSGIAIIEINWKNNIRLRNYGLLISATALIYFLAVTNIFMPAFGGGLLRIDRYSHFGDSAGEIIRTILTNPLLVLNTVVTSKKLAYIFWLLIPLAGVSLYYPPAIILLIPGLAENLLTNFQSQFSGTYQYDALLLPGIFIGSMLGISYLIKQWPDKKDLLKYVLIFTIITAYLFRSPASLIFFPIEIFKSNSKTDAYSELISRIPKSASVSANTNLVPHLSQRSEIYMLGTEFDRRVDFIVIDGGDLSGFSDEEMFQAYGDYYMNSGNYTYEEIQGRYFVLKRRGFSN